MSGLVIRAKRAALRASAPSTTLSYPTWACVDIPALPLQCLLKTEPSWRMHPVAVVERDAPQGMVLWVNARARRCGIAPGMTYAESLSLSSELRARAMDSCALEKTAADITRVLQKHSPNVEPFKDDKGVFWLDTKGLTTLYLSMSAWAKGLRIQLHALGFYSRVVVGFSRFGTYAVAKAQANARGSARFRVRRETIDKANKKNGSNSICVFEDPEEEKRVTQKVSIQDVLSASAPWALRTLKKLAVRTLEDFVALPRGGVLRRFGREAHAVHVLASGEASLPLHAEPHRSPIEAEQILDEPVQSSHALLFIIKPMLESLLSELAKQFLALECMTLTFSFEREHGKLLPPIKEIITPSEPSLDTRVLMRLIQLRAESFVFEQGVHSVQLRAEPKETDKQQLQLFFADKERDQKSAERSLARVKAMVGDDAVVNAELHDGHLPEAQFRWVAAHTIKEPEPIAPSMRGVRRIFTRPFVLPMHSVRPSSALKGWSPLGQAHGPVVKITGPHVISGGWWHREVWRHYFVIVMQSGAVAWLYRDARRRQWFLHGFVI